MTKDETIIEQAVIIAELHKELDAEREKGMLYFTDAFKKNCALEKYVKAYGAEIRDAELAVPF